MLLAFWQCCLFSGSAAGYLDVLQAFLDYSWLCSAAIYLEVLPAIWHWYHLFNSVVGYLAVLEAI